MATATWELFVDGPKGDIVFEHWKESPHRGPDRERIEDQWQKYKPYCGNADHFRSLFRHDCLAAHWEIYVANILIERGFKLEPVGPVGPDILLDCSFGKIWVECVSPNIGNNSDAVIVPDFRPGQTFTRAHSEREYKLRYTQALTDKAQKVSDYIQKGIISPDDCVVIALSGGKLWGADIEDEYPIVTKSLFGVGDEYTTIDIETGETVGGGYHREPTIRRSNGSEVHVALNYLDLFHPISGVLHSTRSWDAFDLEGRDLNLTHNPLCCRPIPIATFRFGREFWVDRQEFWTKDAGTLQSKDHRMP